MYNSYPKGSQWRRWDLHFHTPSSYDYKNKSVSNKDIIQGLKNQGISVIVITDHNLIDIERIKELQVLGEKEDITVLPGIELRAELGGSESIHFIGIFPEDSNLKEIWMELQTKCKLKESDIEKKGHESIYVDFAETAKLMHQLGGLVSIHSGSKSNSIENITNTLSHKMAMKKDIAELVDIFEMGQEKDCDDYCKYVFPAIGREVPMVICSDNHNIQNYQVKQNLWVKADPSFKGLRQITSEPADRVKMCEDSPEDKYKSNVIDKVRFLDASVKGHEKGFFVTFGENHLKLSKKQVDFGDATRSGHITQMLPDLALQMRPAASQQMLPPEAGKISRLKIRF